MGRIAKILIACVGGLAVVAVVLGVFWLWGPAQPALSAVQIASAQNLGFEGTYVAWEGSVDRMIAPSWKLTYTLRWGSEAHLDLPRASDASSPRLEGDKSQHLWQEWKNFDACLYQQIGVTVGHYVRFSAWAKVDADDQLPTDQYRTRVGIDPNGGTNPFDDIEYWTHRANWDDYTDEGGQWQQLWLSIKAISDTVTVYACAHPSTAYRRFDVWWDAAEFEVVPEQLFYVPLVLRERWNPPPPGTLYNPDLELEWGEYEGYQLLYTDTHVAPYWNFFRDNGWAEYNAADRDYRVHHGAVSQQYGESGWGSFEAGIYQVITGTVVSDTVQFTIWGVGWSSNLDGSNDRYSDVRDGLNFRIGIDPYGGESYTAPEIIWSDYYDPYDVWHQFEVTATVQSDRISVWAYAHPAAYWARFNQVFWDDAALTVIDVP